MTGTLPTASYNGKTEVKCSFSLHDQKKINWKRNLKKYGT